MTVMGISVRSILRRIGLEVTRYPAPNTLPWQLRQIVRLRKIDGVIDVGAHWGEFASMVRRDVGFAGAIASYEPVANSFDRLVGTMGSDPMWSGRRLAIGAESATAELNVFSSTDFTSFRRPSELGHQRFGLTVERVEPAEVRRLDEVVSLRGRLILKTDTQGFDLEVLRGAGDILRWVEALVVELPVRNVYSDSPDLITMMSAIGDLGFELVGMFPVSRDRDRLRVIEFDSVFLRAAGRTS